MNYYLRSILLLIYALQFSVQFNLTLLHTEDFQSRFSEVNVGGKAYHGVSRMMHYIKEQKKDPWTIYLDTLDWSMGSIWFNLYHWTIITAFLKLLPIDALCLGDNEMVDGLPGVREKKFLSFLKHINKTVVCSNCDIQHAPHYKNHIKHWKILKVGNKERSIRIGILGVLWIDRIGQMYESMKILKPISTIQNMIESLRRGNISTIILMTHTTAEDELRILQNISGIDFVVGGHSRILYYNGKPPNDRRNQGAYPSTIVDINDKYVPVVHSGGMGEFVGRIELNFDDTTGALVNYTGNPVYMDYSIPKDPAGETMMLKFKEKVEKASKQNLGTTRVPLQSKCAWEECNLGNLICDAFVDYRASQYKHERFWTDAPIAIMHNGGIVADIPADSGNESIITLEHIINVLPNNEIIKLLTINGSLLKEVLEFSVSDISESKKDGFLQFSGLHVVYEMTQPTGKRITFLKARCGQCDVPIYDHVDDSTNYSIIIPQSLAEGGVGYTMLMNKTSISISNSLKDFQILQRYIETYKIVQAGVEERIRISNIPELLGCAQTYKPINYLNIGLVVFNILLERTRKYCKMI